MRSKIIFVLLAILLNSCSSASAQEVKKLKCPIIEGIASFVCPTEFDDYCVYFTGGQCDSTLCAKLTANSCTACSVASSVSYYTESACNASKVFCDDYARPQNCSATDNPVCAYYSSDDCPNGFCSQTARNPCEACGSQFAEYYKPGECTDPSQYTCNAGTLFGQHVNAGPVCAFFTESCPIDLCNRTVSSAAQACEDPSVLYYKLGKCVTETSSCSNVDISSCQLDYHPVCVTVKGCTDTQCAVAAQTFDNDCLACSNSSYQYYASEICLEDQRQCPSQDEVSVLPQDYEPVCAFFSFGGSQTYNNSYSACSQSTSLAYYVNGPCSFNCDEVWTKFNMIPCIGLPVSPVCGYYTEGCSSSDGVCQESFVNSCYGCSTGKLGHFTDGLCPKNQSIYCEPGVSPGSCAVIDPVCAVFEEDCNDASCRQTYQNPCQACEDPTVISFKPDLCSGDNGVPCDPSNRPTQASCKDAITVGPVCGVTDKNCNDASCRQTFDNTCLACADSSIIQFTDGVCSA